MPFWLKNSLDKVYGGYFTCLDQKGEVFDTDKFMWLQAREVYMFASLYNKVEQKQEWLDAAEHGATFFYLSMVMMGILIGTSRWIEKGTH